MKVVILAGGFGTRISEESYLKPKPMIEIGGQPILWHIMMSYSRFGFNEFIICCGYKANIIKEYFANYYMYHSDITFRFEKNEVTIHNSYAKPWTVTVVDTGLNTMTGGRIKRVKEYIGNSSFMLTYGDGVCDIDLGKLYEFHKKHQKMVTLTAVQPGSRFGTLDIDAHSGSVRAFAEKKADRGGWVNGGYMVIEPELIGYIGGDSTVFEREPLEYAAKSNNLVAYKHEGFWQCMDTMRDKKYLESIIEKGRAPWMKWDER